MVQRKVATHELLMSMQTPVVGLRFGVCDIIQSVPFKKTRSLGTASHVCMPSSTEEDKQYTALQTIANNSGLGWSPCRMS